uniref:Uncharacterized protein n=1 Tax=Rhizophora mucronata TaxID=61149 RepID=A0A2P2P939_RHIMU
MKKVLQHTHFHNVNRFAYSQTKQSTLVRGSEHRPSERSPY